MIDIQNLSIRINAKVLLDKTSLYLDDHQRYGLIGKNGCGKSTLLRLLQGEIESETGDVFIPTGKKLVYVEQEIKNLDMPILDYVLSLDREVTELEQRLNTAHGHELAEIHERLNALEAATASARACEILNGLGFHQSDLGRPLSDFSGGWRMRLALAGALFQHSDILLMDEPTNHLDLESTIWLEGFLKKYQGTLLLVSHDKHILNSVCNNILNFENKKITAYKGDYDTFRRTYFLERDLLGKQAQKQEKSRAHLQAFIDRFRYKASKARQAQSRIKQLEKMQKVDIVPLTHQESFKFPEPGFLSPPLMKLEEVSVGYDGKPVLEQLTFSLDPNDRIALLGANGNGKTTLAKLLSGRLQKMDGQMVASSKLSVAYFSQHQAEELPMHETAFEYMSGLMRGQLQTAVRSHLAQFGLEKEKALTEIEKLSGGEKARLLFAAICREHPQLLILDEPTNHLDMDARDALIEAVNDFKGAVILITHDLHIIELIADDLWLVKDGRCLPYDGDLDDYAALLLGTKNRPCKKEEAPKEKPSKNEYQMNAEKKEKLIPLNRSLKKTEERMERRRTRINEIQGAFLNPLSVEETVALQKEMRELEQELIEIESAWLEISEEIEKLS